MNLYVSNLAYTLTDDELRNEFAAFGNVSSARVVKDRETGRSRGFAFVEMPEDAEALVAMRALEGANISGRPMKVVEARPKEERPQRPPGGGGGGAFRERNGGGGNNGGGGGFRERDSGGGGGGGKKRDWSRERGDRSERGGRGGRYEEGFDG